MRRANEPGRRRRATTYWRRGWLWPVAVAALGLTAGGLSACGDGLPGPGVAAVGSTTTAQPGTSSRTDGPAGAGSSTTPPPQGSSQTSGSSGAAGPAISLPKSWSSRSACAPAGCPTSQTRTAAGASNCPPGPIARRPRSRRRRRNARSSCRLGLGPARHPPPRRSPRCLWLPSACAGTASPISPSRGPRSPPRPSWRLRRDQRYRRGDPRLPEHDRRAVAGVRAGGGRLRVPAAQPLMRSGLDGGNPHNILATHPCDAASTVGTAPMNGNQQRSDGAHTAAWKAHGAGPSGRDGASRPTRPLRQGRWRR